MLRIKLSVPGAGSCVDLSQFVGNSENTVSGCSFHVNESLEDADVWFVLEGVEAWDTECRVPPSRVVFLTSESSWEPGFFAEGTPQGDFLGQFPHIYTCHDVYLPTVVNAPPFLPWMINANHGASIFAPHMRDSRFLGGLTELPKSRPISVFCSSQTLTPPHRMRLRFVEKLKEHFGDTLDWFGNGINPLPEKWHGIAPYRYTVVLENQAVANVFTEKIFDAYLGLAYPIYWGAPNLADYFHPASFTGINIRDLKGSIEAIEGLLASDVAETQIDRLVESKRRVLGEYNLFERLARIAGDIAHDSAGEEPEDVRLEPPHQARASRFRGGLTGTAGRALNRMGSRLVGPP